MSRCSPDRITVFSRILRPFEGKRRDYSKVARWAWQKKVRGETIESQFKRNPEARIRRNRDEARVIDWSLEGKLDPFTKKETVGPKVYLTMLGNYLHRCYPVRRIGKSLLNDDRLRRLYSFLHFTPCNTFSSSPQGGLLTVLLFPPFPPPQVIRDTLADVKKKNEFYVFTISSPVLSATLIGISALNFIKCIRLTTVQG